MRDLTISPIARRAAGFVAVVAAITLAVRFYLRLQQSETAFAALSYMTQYFTILTNLMTLILMVWVAVGRDVSSRLVRAVVISIVCVGLIYHTLLAHLVSLSGVELWADHGTHTFVPLLAGIWWLFLAPKPRVSIRDFTLWVAWPLIYCGYILVRAGFSGFYPYPFLNVPEIGWTMLGINVVALSVGFVIVGLFLTAFGSLLSKLKIASH